MFCKNCGSSMDDNAAFCPNCGSQVTGAQVNGAMPTYGTNGAPTPTPTPDKSKAPNIVGLVGFVLAMVGTLLWIIYISATVVVLFYFALGMLIAGIVCSAIGMKRAKTLNAKFKGLSIAGFVVSVVFVSITVFLFIIGLSMLGSIIGSIY